MEEISTYPNHQPPPSLSEAYDISKKIEEKLAEIDRLKEESGITKLEEEIGCRLVLSVNNAKNGRKKFQITHV